MNLGSKASQIYKPRSGGTNKNLQNYTPEMLDYQKSVNEELIHLFGYAKDDRADNNTPFFDFEGKARKSSVDQTCGYKALNTRAMEKRLIQIQKHGKRPPREIYSALPKMRDGEIKLVTHFQVL